MEVALENLALYINSRNLTSGALPIIHRRATRTALQYGCSRHYLHIILLLLLLRKATCIAEFVHLVKICTPTKYVLMCPSLLA